MKKKEGRRQLRELLCRSSTTKLLGDLLHLRSRNSERGKVNEEFFETKQCLFKEIITCSDTLTDGTLSGLYR